MKKLVLTMAVVLALCSAASAVVLNTPSAGDCKFYWNSKYGDDTYTPGENTIGIYLYFGGTYGNDYTVGIFEVPIAALAGKKVESAVLEVDASGFGTNYYYGSATIGWLDPGTIVPTGDVVADGLGPAAKSRPGGYTIYDSDVPFTNGTKSWDVLTYVLSDLAAGRSYSTFVLSGSRETFGSINAAESGTGPRIVASVVTPPNLIDWNGKLVADFGNNGLWYNDGSSWNWMTNTGHVGQMTVWDGKLVADFGAGGLWYYDTAWHWMTNKGAPEMMTTWNNGTTDTLVVDFGAGQGIYTYDGAWNWLSNKDAVSEMTSWNEKLIVDFGSGRGVYNYDGAWNWLTNKDDANLMVPWNNGSTESLVVDFGAGRGVYRYDGSWNWLSNKDDVNDMTVWNSKLVVDFGAGRGVYNYDTAWHWMTNKDDTARMVTWRDAGDNLAVDFGGGRNMYNYNGAWSWVKNANNVPEMTAWNNRLAVDFGAGMGVYNYNGAWNQMKFWTTAE